MARVRAFICALALGAATLVTAAGADTPDSIAGFDRDPDWRTYVDPDRGTAVEYPAAVFSVQAGAPERGSGQEFRTQDARARLIIYTLPNEERRTPRSYLDPHLLLPPAPPSSTTVTRPSF